MGIVFDFFVGLKRSLPILVHKVATFLLLLFTIGLFLGYLIAVLNISLYWLLIPFMAMIITWYKLDEGILFLIALILVAIYQPSLIFF